MGRKWVAGGMAGLLVVAAAVYFGTRRPAPTAPAPVAETPSAAPAEIILTGRLRARQVERIPAPIEGTLESVEVIEGQEVFEGQLLARIRNSRLELEEEQAKAEVERLQTRVNGLESQLMSARLEQSRAEADAARALASRTLAEKNFQRQQMLLREGATARLVFEKSEQEFTKARADGDAAAELARQARSKIEVLQQNLDEAKRQLAEKNQELDDTLQEKLATEVHAPVDGLIVTIKGGAGQEVTRDAKDLFEIATNAAELELVAELPAGQPLRIEPGQLAVIQVVEAGNQPLAGKVKSVSSSVAVIEIEAVDPSVKPGLTAQARLVPASTGSPAPRPQ